MWETSRRLPPSCVHMSFLIEFNLSIVILDGLVFKVRSRPLDMRTAFRVVNTMRVILVERRLIFLVD
jgi:hypothetical protein